MIYVILIINRYPRGLTGAFYQVGWGRRIRTSIGDSKGRCPAIGRSPNR
jgi:hypothetical protein